MSASSDTTPKQPPANPATQQSDKDATTPTGATERTNDDDDDEDEWRHEPIAPVDERNPLKSLGHAIADVATGGAEPTPKPKPPGR